MKLNGPVLALILPNNGDDFQSHELYALNVYGAFICSRLRADAGSYYNASVHVAGASEKNILMTLCNEKLADLKALDRACSGYSDSEDGKAKFETPSYTQYILDANFDPLLDIIDVFHFAYRREYKTLELFDRLEQSAAQVMIKALLSDATRRQRATILRLDGKLADARFDALSTKEIVHTNLYQAPAL